MSQALKQPNEVEEIENFFSRSISGPPIDEEPISVVEYANWKINPCTRYIIAILQKERKKLISSAEISANDGRHDKSNNYLIRTSEISRVLNLVINQKYEL